ncbi:hypothetical protein ACU635_43560 [[Actinomadura] parvosata]|uniref:hypothetical protein n=1 Tax=[Actinomadura] parvosata TaxID=1955412 RepID=UPI00406C2FF2
MDAIRVAFGGPAQTLAAVDQIRALADRLRKAGREGRKLFVHDAGYDLAVLVYELHGERDASGEHARWCADLPDDTHHQLRHGHPRPRRTAARGDAGPPRSRCGCFGPATASRTWADAGDHIFAGSTSSTT